MLTNVTENPRDNTISAITVADAARRLSVSESHTWKMIRDGELRVVKFGRRTIVPVAEILRIVNGGLV